jgi:putative chitobiose transport system substrate-binding protein
MKSQIFKLFILSVVVAIVFGGCAQPSTQTTAPPAPTNPPVATQKLPEPTTAPTSPPMATQKPTEAPPTAEVVTIKYLEHFSTEWGNEWFAKTIAEFEKLHPNIKIDHIAKPWNDLWPLLTAGAQSGDMPDVFATHGAWLSSLGEWNALYDLRPIIEKYADAEYIQNTGAQGPYALGTYKGKVLGATWGYFTYGLFYNKEYFEQNNLKVPSTWDELETLLRTVRKEKNIYGLSVVWGKAEGGDHWPYLQWGWRVRGAGGNMYDAEGKPAFNTPEGKLGMEYWKRLYDGDLISPNAEAMTVQQARGDFCAGKVLMIIDGPWIKGTCQTLGGKFTVAMVPGLCGEKTCGSAITPQFLSVGANSKHPEAAFEFIKYMQSDAVTIDWGKSFGMTTANPAFLELPENKSDPIMGVVLKVAANKDNLSLPSVPNTVAINKMLLDEWQKVLLEGKSIDAALKDMETQWLELMKVVE